MAERITKAFAVSGDKTAVPENSTSTEISFDQGWTSAYELAQGNAGARDISRPQHNYLWNVITDNIKQSQEQAFPEFYSDIAYSVGSVVIYTDDENYICHTSQAAGTLPTDNSAFINFKFYGAYAYAVSQLANGVASNVGFIYIDQTVDSFDYLIYPEDGRVYERGAVTGTITGAFNPADGTAAGLTANLTQVNGVTKREVDLYKQSVLVNFDTDANITLTHTQNLYGRVVLTDNDDVLTTERELIVSDDERFLIVVNKTDYDITAKTSAGSGIAILSGQQAKLITDGVNVVNNEFEIGVNQKYQNLTASRSLDVIFTNSETRPIFVEVTFLQTGTSTSNFEIDGVDFPFDTVSGVSGSASRDFVIPAGSQYRLKSANIYSYNWYELR